MAAATRCKAGAIVRSRRRAGWLAALALIGLTFCLAPKATAACIDLKQANKLSFEGMLNYRIFAGPPNYEDVRKGDTPEPTYILTLTEPICASGDEFVDPERQVRSGADFSRFLRQSRRSCAVERPSPFGRKASCCGRGFAVRRTYRTSSCPAGAAHNQNFGCFRPHGILRHCHDDRASVLRGTGRGQR